MYEPVLRILDIQTLDTVEYTHHLIVPDRHILWIQACHILQLPDHGRRIVPQNIQLQQVLIDRMIIKMCRDNVRFHVVGRMLYRTELIDLMTVRHDDDTPRMLSRSLFDPCTAVRQTIHLSLVDADLPLFKISRHITIGDPVLDRTDGSCFIYIFLAENLFDILLRRTLIFPGKIQVDIRLLVGFKSQERLKRDRKPFLTIRCAAFRADLVRHIHAAVVKLFVAPFQVLAVRTQVVRRQRIYFGDSRHGCCKGGSYGSSRSYQVSIRKGFLYQKLR